MEFVMAYPPRGHSSLLPVLLVITLKPWLLPRPCTRMESRSWCQAQLLNAYLLLQNGEYQLCFCQRR